jgi:hypothetical protein
MFPCPPIFLLFIFNIYETGNRGEGTGASVLNTVGGLFALLAFLFGGQPRALGGFGFGTTLKYCYIPPSPTHAFAV